MKKEHLLILLFFIFSTISYGKKNDTKSKDVNVININDTNYATVKIGTQTSVNYNGPGGENYNRNLDNDPVTGKFYSLTQAMAITLPAGWRLPTRGNSRHTRHACASVRQLPRDSSLFCTK